MVPRLDAVASISRTSGIDSSGDALRDFRFQEEYAQRLSDKVAAHWTRFPPPDGEDHTCSPNNAEQLECENLLIAFRKLREGILASHRVDAFAIHVYESSFLLSVLFRLPTHATASLAHLLQVLYPAQPSTGLVPATGMLHTLLHLAHPAEFLTRLRAASSVLSPDVTSWLATLARYKRTGNFVAARLYTQPARIPNTLVLDVDGSLYGGRADVGRRAVQRLLALITVDMTRRTWDVLRAAYREAIVHDSADWLAQSLALDRGAQLDHWVHEKIQKGELREAETNGRLRWTFVKAKT